MIVFHSSGVLPETIRFTQVRMLPRWIVLIDERMSVDERRNYVKPVAPRYADAGRSKRSRLLTERSVVTGLHRKGVLHPPLAKLQTDTEPLRSGIEYPAEYPGAALPVVLRDSPLFHFPPRLLQPNLEFVERQQGVHRPETEPITAAAGPAQWTVLP